MTTPISGRVRVAIVGCGAISKEHAKGVLAHCDKIECVALCDVSEKNLQDRSEQLGGVDAHNRFPAAERRKSITPRRITGAVFLRRSAANKNPGTRYPQLTQWATLLRRSAADRTRPCSRSSRWLVRNAG